MKISYLKWVFICLVAVVPANVFAQSAQLFFTTNAQPTVGSTFPLVVRLTSDIESVNAVSAAISFSSEYVEIVSISRANSIINFWAQEPQFSNSNSTASFEGVILNPGFKGSSASLVTINVRPKKVGSTSFGIKDHSVLANDGKATPLKVSASAFRIDIAPPLPPVKQPEKKEVETQKIPEPVKEVIRVVERYIPPIVLQIIMVLVLIIFILLGILLTIMYAKMHRADRSWKRVLFDLRRHVRDLYVLESRRGFAEHEKESFQKIEKDIKDIEKKV